MASGDEPLPTSQRHESSKLPMAIKERDVEYQVSHSSVSGTPARKEMMMSGHWCGFGKSLSGWVGYAVVA